MLLLHLYLTYAWVLGCVDYFAEHLRADQVPQLAGLLDVEFWHAHVSQFLHLFKFELGVGFIDDFCENIAALRLRFLEGRRCLLIHGRHLELILRILLECCYLLIDVAFQISVPVIFNLRFDLLFVTVSPYLLYAFLLILHYLVDDAVEHVFSDPRCVHLVEFRVIVRAWKINIMLARYITQLAARVGADARFTLLVVHLVLFEAIKLVFGFF